MPATDHAKELRAFLEKFEPVKGTTTTEAEAEFIRKNTLLAKNKDGVFARLKGRLVLLYPYASGGIRMKFADGKAPPKSL
jgi:hypothetical protein